MKMKNWKGSGCGFGFVLKHVGLWRSFLSWRKGVYEYGGTEIKKSVFDMLNLRPKVTITLELTSRQLVP